MLVEFVALMECMGVFFRQPELQGSDQPPRPLKPEPRDPVRSAVWNATVRDMAQRGISAGELVDFFCELGGTAMPWYDPWRHTTNDVVRAAIIPMSRQGKHGCAYASVIAHGAEARPLAERLCTHDWRNLFLHLVSAVVADALDQDEYGWISAQ